MGFRDQYAYVNCWACGRKSLAETLALLLRVPIGAAIDLAKSIPRVDSAPDFKPQGTYCPPAGIQPMTSAHLSYLTARGLDGPTIAKLWGVQGIGQMGGRLAWSLFIPIHHRGQLVSWTSRAIGKDAGWRYQSASPEEESHPHKSTLYGMDYVRHVMYIVEGPTDAWAIGPGAVATWGLDYTKAQLALMASFPVRVVVFDNSDAAQQRAADLCQILSATGPTHNVQLDADDPGSADKTEIAGLIDHFGR